jgi:hypothetical protein
MKAFFSIILALAVSISTALAKHGGHGGHRGHGRYHGKQDKHFSSVSSRGGHKFSRSGSEKFSRGNSGKYRNWGGRNWSGGNWSGNWRHHGFYGDRFIFTGGFGYPYYWGWYPSLGWSVSWGWYPSWGWSVPYALSYGYDSYGYYPSYGYEYGYPNYWNSYPDWAWSVPYAFNYDYYSYGYNPSYGYDYGYNSDPAYEYGNGSSIAQLQRRLAKAGYYNGAIDGIMGPATRRAIRTYERDYGRLSMQ